MWENRNNADGEGAEVLEDCFLSSSGLGPFSRLPPHPGPLPRGEGELCRILGVRLPRRFYPVLGSRAV